MQPRVSLSTRKKKELTKKIKHARETGNLAWFQRLNAMFLLLGVGLLQDEVATCAGVCTRTIQRWLVLLLAGGPKKLIPKTSSGRPSKLTKTQRQELYEDIVKGPEECGYPTGVWTSELIQDHIKKRFGKFYSQFYIPELLKNIGCSFIKPKRHYKLSDDEVREHILWIRKHFNKLLKRVERSGGVLLFEDEAGMDMQTGQIRTWAGKGNPPNQPNNPKKDSVKLMGTIEFRTGNTIYRIFDEKDKRGKKKNITNKEMADFLRYVLRKYPKQEVFIVWDNAPYHYGPHIRKLQELNPRLHLEYLPSKAPHLNPIEKLWKEVKKARLHIRHLLSKDMLKAAIRSAMTLFQRNKEKVISLMTIWEEIAKDARGAKKGKYDHLMPKGYEHLYQYTSTVKIERTLNS